MGSNKLRWALVACNRQRPGNKRLHATPLPKLARKIISALEVVEGNPYVFVGRRKGGHLDPGTPLQKAVKKASDVDDFYWHALRHTAETRMAELGILPHVRDLVLDHAPPRGSGAGYDHHHYRDEMKEALQTWEKALQKIVCHSPKHARGNMANNQKAGSLRK